MNASNNAQHVLRRVSIRAHLDSSKGIKNNFHHLHIIQNLQVASLHFKMATMEEHPILNASSLKELFGINQRCGLHLDMI